MPDYQVISLIKEIEINTGVDIKIKCRKRTNVYSRVVFFKILKKLNPKMTLNEMGGFLGLNHATVIYALSSYENLRYYPDFIEIEREIESIKLYKTNTSMIFCNPTTYPNGKN